MLRVAMSAFARVGSMQGPYVLCAMIRHAAACAAGRTMPSQAAAMPATTASTSMSAARTAATAAAAGVTASSGVAGR
jgi:hypothetical protein